MRVVIHGDVSAYFNLVAIRKRSYLWCGGHGSAASGYWLPLKCKQRQNGKKLTGLKRKAVAHICLEVDSQGGCITAAELALILKITTPTIGKYIVHWQTLAPYFNFLPRYE